MILAASNAAYLLVGSLFGAGIILLVLLLFVCWALNRAFPDGFDNYILKAFRRD